MTVLDLLNKIGVDDNISFYGDNKGKQDLVLDICWAESFKGSLFRHLSAQEEGKRVDGASAADE